MIDFSQVIDILLGNTPVEQVSDSRGNVLWSSAPVVLLNYFYVEDKSGQNNTMSITKSSGNAPTIEVFKSTDGTNWESMGSTSTTAITATIPANGKLYLKATANAWGTPSYYNTINTTGNCNVGGDIMSLLYGDNFTGEETTFPSGSTYNFMGLFQSNTHLVDTSSLILPATTLAEECYYNMFAGCTSLTAAPALPATTLANGCYYNMFNGCTSLTAAPELPATTLVANCYRTMFQSCTSLNKVTTYAQDISASYCLLYWLNGVSLTGTFYNMACTTYPEGASGILNSWTELHTKEAYINVTITNTSSYSGATYQIDSGTAQPINETGTTSFAVPVTSTTLTIHRNGKGVTEVGGICGISSDSEWTTVLPVNKMSDNVNIDLVNLM